MHIKLSAMHCNKRVTRGVKRKIEEESNRSSSANCSSSSSVNSSFSTSNDFIDTQKVSTFRSSHVITCITCTTSSTSSTITTTTDTKKAIISNIKNADTANTLAEQSSPPVTVKTGEQAINSTVHLDDKINTCTSNINDTSNNNNNNLTRIDQLTTKSKKTKLSKTISSSSSTKTSTTVSATTSITNRSDELILRNCLTSSSPNLVNTYNSNYSRTLTSNNQLIHQNPSIHQYHQQQQQQHNHLLTCTDMRSLIFNLSMGKLSRYRQSPDPRLVRSVLICNTLKRLEKELDKEGIKINFGPSGVSFFPPINTQNMTLDPPPNASQSSSYSSTTSSSNLSTQSSSTSSSSTSIVSTAQPSSSTTSSSSPSQSSSINLSNIYSNDNDFYMDDNEKLSDEENDAEKYLLDLDASNSGRVTPFPRSPLNECLYNNQLNKENILSSDICSSTTNCKLSTLMEVTSSITQLNAQELTPVTNTSKQLTTTAHHQPGSTTITNSINSSTENNSVASSSALWNSCDEPADRLTSLNWSSVLNFGSINNSINGSLNEDNLDQTMDDIDYDIYDNGPATNKCLDININEKDIISSSTAPITTSLHTLLPPVTIAENASHLINHHHHLHHSHPNHHHHHHNHHHNHHHHHHSNHLHHSLISSTSTTPSSSPSSISSSSMYSNSSGNDEIFGDIDLSLYDFDLLSPLSPPNVKLAPVTAEELIQAVSSDSNTSSSTTSSLSCSSTTSSSHPLLLSSISSSSSSLVTSQATSTTVLNGNVYTHSLSLTNAPATSANNQMAVGCTTGGASSATSCGSSVNTKSAFHTHYLTNNEKLLFDEMSSVMS